jgi:hypothetical protein
MQKVNHLILQLPFCCYSSCIRAWAYRNTKYFFLTLISFITLLVMMDSIYYKHFLGFYCVDLITFVKPSCSICKPTPLITSYLCFLLFKNGPCSNFHTFFFYQHLLLSFLVQFSLNFFSKPKMFNNFLQGVLTSFHNCNTWLGIFQNQL